MQTPADLLQLGPAVGGVHEGGEVETPLALQPLENLLGRLAGIDDAQDLILTLDLGGQFIVVHPPRPPEGHAPEYIPPELLRRADLGDRLLRGKFPENGGQCRLCGGAQDRGDPVALDQLGDGPDAGTQIGEREHLRLIQDNHALGDMVEFPALRRFAGVE